MVVIIILIGLVLARRQCVKKAAYVANTQSELSTIAGAMQRYYSDFGAYPGAYRQYRHQLALSAAASPRPARKRSGEES